MNSTEKYSCVVNMQGDYVEFVLQLLTKLPEGGENWVVQYYRLKEGERLVDTMPPARRIHAGAVGLIYPRWDEGSFAWVEGATAQEIAAWEAEHLAPEPPPMDELTMTQLAVAELAAAIEENNTANQLAVAELAETILGGNA